MGGHEAPADLDMEGVEAWAAWYFALRVETIGGDRQREERTIVRWMRSAAKSLAGRAVTKGPSSLILRPVRD